MKSFKVLVLGIIVVSSFSAEVSAEYLHFEDEVEKRRIDQYIIRMERNQVLLERKAQSRLYNYAYNANTQRLKDRNKAEINFYSQKNREYQARESALLQHILQKSKNQRALSKLKQMELLAKIDSSNLPNNNKHNYKVASQHVNYVEAGKLVESKNNSQSVNLGDNNGMKNNVGGSVNSPYNYSYYNSSRSTLQQWQQESVHGAVNSNNQIDSPLSQYSQYLNINGEDRIISQDNTSRFESSNSYYCPNNNYRCY